MSRPNSQEPLSKLVAFRRGASSKIDAETRVITDVIMCQAGEAKGHGVWLETSFIEDAAKFAQKHSKGLKSRFGHYAGEGAQLGRFKNIRQEGDKLLGDMHLLKSADSSPKNPGMASWLLSLADEDPDFVMCSIVFYIDHYYQYDRSGKKIKVWVYDEDGSWVSANRKMKIYVAIKSLEACDIVESGAATERLFSAALQEKISHYESQTPKNMKLSTAWTAILAFLGLTAQIEKDEDAPEVTAEMLDQLNGELAARGEQIIGLQKQLVEAQKGDEAVQALQTERDSLKAQLTEKDKKVAELTAEVARLGKQPGGKPTTPPRGEPEGLGDDEDDPQSIIDNLPHNKAYDNNSYYATLGEK